MNDKPILTADAVRAVLEKCLYTADELQTAAAAGGMHAGVPNGSVVVRGVVRDYGFHPMRIAEARAEIAGLLTGLSDEFYQGGGGGQSFLRIPFDRHGNHWCEHPTAEALAVLAIGAGLARWITEEREIWKLLPGGVPYLTVLKPAEPVQH